MPLRMVFDRAQELLRPVDDCYLALGNGLCALARQLTPSHSLTSRRYAVWPLVRCHIDPAYTCFYNNNILMGHTCYSEFLHRIGEDHRSGVMNHLLAWVLVRLWLSQSHSKKMTRNTMEIQEIDYQVANLDKWEGCLQCTTDCLFSVRSIPNITGGFNPHFLALYIWSAH